MSSEGIALACWGHSVGAPQHVSTALSPPSVTNSTPSNDLVGASPSSGGVGGHRVAYIATPRRVVMSGLVEEGSVTSSGSSLHQQRVFNLPTRHIVSCVALHPTKPLIAIGTQDHGAFVLPLENENGVVTAGESAPLQCDDQAVSLSTKYSSSKLFSVETQCVSAATGSTVVALAFVDVATSMEGSSESSPTSAAASSSAAFSSVCLAMISTKKSSAMSPPSSSTSSTPVSIFSLWSPQPSPLPLSSSPSQQGSDRSRSPTAASPLSLTTTRKLKLAWSGPPSEYPLQAVITFPSAVGVMVTMSKRDILLWKARRGDGTISSPPPSSSRGAAAAAAATTLEVKSRTCSTIPELKGAEFVGVACCPPMSSSRRAAVAGAVSSTTTTPLDCQLFALTTAGFLVCYDRRDGSIVKWMDCKVCPATSITCTETHVIVAGATVRFFSVSEWDFQGKVAISGTMSSVDVASAASGYLATLFRTLCVGVSAATFQAAPSSSTATSTSLLLFYGNGEMHRYLISESSRGGEEAKKKKLSFSRKHIVPVVDASQQPLQFLLEGRAASPSAAVAMPSPLVLWTPSCMHSVNRYSMEPLSINEECETSCAILLPSLSLVVAYGTLQQSFVVLDAVSLKPVQRLTMSGMPLEGAPLVNMISLSKFTKGNNGNDDVLALQQETLLGVTAPTAASGSRSLIRFNVRLVESTVGLLASDVASNKSQLHVHIELAAIRPLPLPSALAANPAIAAASAHHIPILGFAGDVLCCALHNYFWNIKACESAVTLPLTPTRVVALPERLLFVSQTEAKLCFVDPANMRVFAFDSPSAIADIRMDDDMRYVCALSSPDRNEVIVMSMRDRCAVVDRVKTSSANDVFHTFALNGRYVSSGGGNKKRTSDGTATNNTTLALPLLAVVEGRQHLKGMFSLIAIGDSGSGGEGGQPAVVASVAAVRGRGREAAVAQKPVVTTKESHVDPARRDGNNHEPEEEPTNRRRTLSCGATPTTTEDLKRRFSELRKMADLWKAPSQPRRTSSTISSAAPPAPSSISPQDASKQEQQQSSPAVGRQHHEDPAALNVAASSSMPSNEKTSSTTAPSATSGGVFIGDRRRDPFRQSGLLLTQQVQESSKGDVVLRLGTRWGDAWTSSTSAAATAHHHNDLRPTAEASSCRPAVFSLPVIRSHDVSSIDESEAHELLAAAEVHRDPAVPAAQATETLIRRMQKRSDGMEQGGPSSPPQRMPLGESSQGCQPVSIQGIVQSSVPITDSIASRLLAHERNKVGCDEAEQPAPCLDSPIRTGTTQVAFDGNADGGDDDFVVMDSITIADNAALGVGATRMIKESPGKFHPRFDDDDDGDLGEEDSVSPLRDGAPPKVMFAAALQSKDESAGGASSSSLPVLRTLRPSDAPRQTLKPNQSTSESTTEEKPTTLLRRASTIRLAADNVRSSILHLKQLLAAADEDAQVAETCDASATEDWVTQELSSVLAEVVATMQVNTQRLSSRPGSSNGTGGLARMVTTLDNTPTNNTSSSATLLSSSADPLAASAMQFHLLWSEMQRVQQQNSTILSMLQKSTK